MTLQTNEIDIGLYCPLIEAAKDLGVSRAAIAYWLSSHKLKRYCIMHEGKLHVSLSILQKYLAVGTTLGIERATRKPKGWVTTKAVAMDLGCHLRGVHHAILKKRIRAVFYAQVIYCHPEDVKRYKLEYPQTPLPGYVQVRTAMKNIGRTKAAFWRWAKTYGKPTKEFRNPLTGRICLYATEELIEEYRVYTSRRGV